MLHKWQIADLIPGRAADRRIRRDYCGVFDGWHRGRSCKVIGIEPRLVVLAEGSDPAAFVLTENLFRRHLNASQRAMAVAACSEWAPVGSNQHATGGSAPGAVARTTDQLARSADVSERTMYQAKVVVTKAVPEVQAKIKAGELSVKAAAAIAVLPPGEQLRSSEHPHQRSAPVAAPSAATAKNVALVMAVRASCHAIRGGAS